MTKRTTTMEYQKAIDYIFQMIKEGKLIVGSKIPSERDIAEQLGIGRNSIREAISILRGMGLIESIQGSGNYIAKDSGRTIWNIVSVMLALGSISMKDILEFRRVMARAVIELIFKNGFDDEDKEHLEKIIGKMKSASGEKLVMLDQEFHITLIRATRNPLFIIVMEAIAEVYHESMSKVIGESDEETTRKLIELHSKICNSIVEKDEEACLKYMKDHYDLVESKLN
ncbi:MAG: GntR family transcriptional regulator [Lachnospiraceae bacterium]|nr:GntR family transcriptional regulator [Lachnospiraceae bacterium]